MRPRPTRCSTLLFPAVAAALNEAIRLVGSGAMLGHGEQAARLFGAAETLCELAGLVMPNAASHALYEAQQAPLRVRLAPEVPAASRSAGRAMSLAEAVDEALAEVG